VRRRRAAAPRGVARSRPPVGGLGGSSRVRRRRAWGALPSGGPTKPLSGGTSFSAAANLPFTPCRAEAPPAASQACATFKAHLAQQRFKNSANVSVASARAWVQASSGWDLDRVPPVGPPCATGEDHCRIASPSKRHWAADPEQWPGTHPRWRAGRMRATVGRARWSAALGRVLEAMSWRGVHVGLASPEVQGRQPFCRGAMDCV